MGEVFEEVTGLGPVGVEDLFLINSNEETSVPKTLKFDEGNCFLTFLISIDLWLVFLQRFQIITIFQFFIVSYKVPYSRVPNNWEARKFSKIL